MPPDPGRDARLQRLGIVLPPSPPDAGMAVLRAMFIRTFLSWETVFHEALTPEDVIGWASQINTETVIVFVSLISHMLAVSRYERRTQLQKLLVSNFFSPVARGPIEDALADSSEQWLVFHDEQLLLAIKLAILYGRAGAAELTTESRHAVGRFLLGVNDLLRRGDLDNPESAAMLGFAMRALYMGAHEPPAYVVARYHDLLVNRMAAALTAGEISLDIDRNCRAEHSLGVEDIIALAFFWSAPFGPLNPNPPFAPGGALGFYHAGDQLLGRLQAHERAETIIQMFGADRAQLRAELDDSTPLDQSNFIPLATHPFYRLEGGGVIPVHHRLMLDKLSVGTYWTLLGLTR